jgi:hypothetical protein
LSGLVGNGAATIVQARWHAAGALSIKPKGKAKKKLNDKGKANVEANVTYTPLAAPGTKRTRRSSF